MIIRLLQKPWWALLTTFLVLLLCVLPSQDLPDTGSLNDKASHFIAFAAITFLWLWVYQNRTVWILLSSTAFGLVIEVIQALLPASFYRSFDWLDWLADSIGVLIGFILYLLSRKVLK
ncbi:VanZ family protein [Jiulongibacter sp. NS-SX5]|uniref:VanZ family protein n=1 Tax=Jiulongibacter sp. NS-SX5 TaxID=3463854 RepID=UPI00405868D5